MEVARLQCSGSIPNADFGRLRSSENYVDIIYGWSLIDLRLRMHIGSHFMVIRGRRTTTTEVGETDDLTHITRCKVVISVYFIKAVLFSNDPFLRSRVRATDQKGIWLQTSS